LRKHYLKKDLKSLIRGKVVDVDAEVDKLSRIAAMITNFDQNVGRLFAMLKETDQYDNTLVFLMTDNGPNTMRYVGDLRGMKTNVVEGGIRTPLWSHWPDGLMGGQTVETTVAAHIDLFPTIAEVCQAKLPDGLKIDGRSLMPQLKNPAKQMAPRTLFMQIHRGTKPQLYHNFMVRDSMWKLVHPSGFGTQTFEGEAKLELYNLDEDPGETNNLAQEYPQKFDYLKTLYEAWFEDVMSNGLTNPGPPDIIIDGEHENPSVLTWQDRVADHWSAGSNGHWELDFARDGRFDIQVDMPREFAPKKDGELVLSIGNDAYEVPIQKGVESVSFPIITVSKGAKLLKADIHYGDGSVEGGYQVRITER
jgi:arylsulfatase/arylsulfatase A